MNRKNKRAKTENDNTETEVGDECENSKGKNSMTKSNDQIEMEAEDETNMVFDRSQTWWIYFKHLSYISGEDYMRKDGSGNETCNLSKIQNVLQKYAVDDMNDDEFTGKRKRSMSKPTFNNCRKGHYTPQKA